MNETVEAIRKLFEGTNKADAWNLLSAIRGPDSPERSPRPFDPPNRLYLSGPWPWTPDLAKEYLTSPIRYALGLETNGRRQMPQDFNVWGSNFPNDFDQRLQTFESLVLTEFPGLSRHYVTHIFLAANILVEAGYEIFEPPMEMPDPDKQIDLNTGPGGFENPHLRWKKPATKP
jgi:hypothetical protein